MSDTAQLLTDRIDASPARVRDYVDLLKPRVMSLVVFTALTGLVCANVPVHPLLGNCWCVA